MVPTLWLETARAVAATPPFRPLGENADRECERNHNYNMPVNAPVKAEMSSARVIERFGQLGKRKLKLIT